MAKYNKLLVIDDDQTHNLLCESLMLEANIFKEVICILDIEEALSYLSKHVSKGFPSHIFLDLSFPENSGWDFLSKYQKIFANESDKAVIYILTSSVSKNDLNRAKESPLVNGFINKPFNHNKLFHLFG